ncbi:hypothetical protein [Micromonospora sp. NBC_01412]|uniref:hypothetical protein n=1 Tax=Micromonospora sp. NBC_01412 TaxID=2903590 RepID=UPI00324BE0F3
MRDEGQTGIEVTEDGKVSFPAAGVQQPGAGGDPGSDAYGQAEKACNAKVPGYQQTRAEDQREYIEKIRAFVKCARENGFPNTPDPDPTTGVLVIRTAEQVNELDRWDKAFELCGKLAEPYSPGYTTQLDGQ